MPSLNLTSFVSRYGILVADLKQLVIAIQDDDAETVLPNFYDVSYRVNRALGEELQEGIFMIDEVSEEREDNGSNTVLFSCFLVYGTNDSTFGTTFHKIIDLLEFTFQTTTSTSAITSKPLRGVYTIEDKNRNGELPERLMGSTNQGNPYWSTMLTIRASKIGNKNG